MNAGLCRFRPLCWADVGSAGIITRLLSGTDDVRGADASAQVAHRVTCSAPGVSIQSVKMADASDCPRLSLLSHPVSHFFPSCCVPRPHTPSPLPRVVLWAEEYLAAERSGA